jgi:hypothetical protein
MIVVTLVTDVISRCKVYNITTSNKGYNTVVLKFNIYVESLLWV